MSAPLRWLLAVVVALLGASCGGGGDDAGADAAPPAATRTPSVTAAVASFDLAAASPQPFLLGLIGPEQESIAYGSIELTFTHIGTAARPLPRPEPGPEARARFVAVSGDKADADLRGPRSVPAADALGVYRTAPIVFPDAGFWEVTAAFRLDGEPVTVTAAFEVLAEHQVPSPGDQAPRTRQPLAGDPGVPAVAIDSRAEDNEQIPDPELHAVTVADALDQGRPTTVVVSTPTYCTSRFCGPVTETVAAVATRYGDRMAFVHLEVWADFENQEVSPAAAEWILRGGAGGNEPWVFVIAADGVIAHRFDNVADEAALDAAVQDVLA